MNIQIYNIYILMLNLMFRFARTHVRDVQVVLIRPVCKVHCGFPQLEIYMSKICKTLNVTVVKRFNLYRPQIILETSTSNLRNIFPQPVFYIAAIRMYHYNFLSSRVSASEMPPSNPQPKRTCSTWPRYAT